MLSPRRSLVTTGVVAALVVHSSSRIDVEAFASVTTLPPCHQQISRQHFRQPVCAQQMNSRIEMMMMIPQLDADMTTVASSSLLTSVTVFDGKSVVDPVVVSNAFWAGLTRQFVSLIIGQILAATAFGIITTFASSQLTKLGSFVSENIFQGDGLKKPPPDYQGGLRVTPDFNKLFVCIVIDMIGTSSELIPFVGELTDLAWAPVAALLLRSLYGSNVIFALEFAEEVLPFTDILPLASICWVIDTLYADSEVAKALELGIYSSKPRVTDTKESDSTFQVNSDYDRTRRESRRRAELQNDRSVIDVEDQNLERGVGRQIPPDKWL